MPAPLGSAGAMLSPPRLHAAIQAGLGKLQRAPGRPSGTPASNALPAEVETLLERVVGPQAYHRDETWHRQVMEHFRYNLARMADIARSAGAQMIFINPASNLRNCAPFKSEHRAGLTEENLARWQEILQRARQAALENRWTDSLALIDQAAAIDDQFADLHFFRARVLWEQQQFDEARRAYIRARDEDVCPLRALSPMLSLVAE